MRKLFSNLFISYLLIAPFYLYSQSEGKEYVFENLSISDGLSNNTVIDIIQDNYGFIWITTEDGLNRYDGYQFEIFRHAKNDTFSLPQNFLKNLYLDKAGNIAIRIGSKPFQTVYYQYGSGIVPWDKYINVDKTIVPEMSLDTIIDFLQHTEFRYDSISENILVFEKMDDTLVIRDIICLYNEFAKDVKSKWFTYRNGVFLLDRDKDKITLVRFFPDENITKAHFTDSLLWFITEDNRLVKYNMYSDLTCAIFQNVYKMSTLDGSNLLLVSFQDEVIQGYGLGIYNMRTDSVRIINFDCIRDNSYRYRINSFTEVDGLIWLGVDHVGICVYDKNGEFLYEIRSDQELENSINGYRITKFFNDKNQNVWLATEQNGVNLMLKKKNVIRNYSMKSVQPVRTGGNFVRGLCYDSLTGNLWIGTRDGGLTRINFITRTSKVHLNDSEGKFYIESILPADEGILWLGTYFNGILRYNYKNGKLEKFDYPILNRNANYIRNIYKDKQANTWFCTMGGGLIKLPADNGPAIQVLEYSREEYHKTVFTIVQSISGDYFIGTENEGVIRINEDGEILKSFKERIKEVSGMNVANIVFSLFEDKNGILWAGTFGAGLLRIDPETDSIRIFNTSHGLCNDVVYGILEDNRGNLWLSTNYSLSCFNPINETFRNFSSNDGLAYDAFQFGAYCKDDKGNMYFGTQEGVSSFHPDSLLKIDTINTIVIKQFHIHSSDRMYSFPDTNQTIKLSYLTENLFSIDFVSPEFVDQDKIHYAYKIEPLHDDWIDIGTQQRLVISDIPHGNYKIRIRSMKIPDKWNSSFTSIPVFIKPPFWATWVFRMGVVVIIIIIFLIILWNKRRNAKRVKAIRTKLAHDLHDEIGSNICSISLIGHKLARNKTDMDEINKASDDIILLSTRTVESIRDIIWFMKPENDCPDKIKTRLKDYIVRILGDIEYVLKLDDEFFRNETPPVLLRNVYLMIKELVNNVAKHSGANFVEIKLRKTSTVVIVEVSDNGKGIKGSSEGTGMQSLRKRTKESGGKLEIDSNGRSGTRISITIEL